MSFSKFGSMAVALLLVLCSVSSVLCYSPYKFDMDAVSKAPGEPYVAAALGYFPVPISLNPTRYPLASYNLNRGGNGDQTTAQRGAGPEKRFDTLNGEMYGR